MMMKIIPPLLFSTLLFSSHSFATVGGPQNIEVLGLDQADQKIYVMRHYLDGRVVCHNCIIINSTAKPPPN